MKSKQRLKWILLGLMLIAFAMGSLLAQDGENAGIPSNIGYPSNPAGPSSPADQANAGNPANDPPSRVARIQYISGDVSLQPGGVNDWVAASLNRPLTTSDRVWTDKNSRVELNVGSAFLRMDSESSLTLTNVSNNSVQAELDQGILELTVLHLEPGEVFEVDTPNTAFTVMKSGVYVFTVRPNDDQTWVTVRKGNGQATGNGPAVKVGSGEQARFSGNAMQYQTYAAPDPDGFEDWAQVRDKRLDGSQAARYVAPGVIGYQDLDYYGRWQTVPTYGPIWVPNSVPVGWAPYRFGHWAWIAPWGWTWIDDAPWGFAPFHYGRWVSYGGFWGWAPGPVYVGWRPYYAPALVGWVGGGGWGFGISFGFGFGGGCGWFPLGWGEPYYPWYHGYRGGFVSQTYIRNVNITNTHITNITNVTNNYYRNSMGNTQYANRMVPGAVTAAPKSALASGQSIAKAGMAVPKSELGRGAVMRSADVTPAKGATMGGQPARSNTVPPRSAFNRQAVTQATTPARTSTPSMEAHNVPQSPAPLAVHNPAGESGSTTSNGPRPQERNGGGTTPSASSYNAQSGSHSVPKPSYAGRPAPHSYTTAAQAPAGSNGHSSAAVHEGSQAPHPPASSNHGQPSPSKQDTTRENPRPGPGVASSGVPTSGYSYHAAPAYASSPHAASASSGNSSGRASYAPPAPAYRPGASYGSASAHSALSYAPAMPHYSGSSPPHYSGGGHSSGGSSGQPSGGGHSSGHSH